MTLTERKRRVLEAIIDSYVATAEPVGSRTIARKYRLGVSPATIRNEMADLEELGYLEQPHTSAGRVPSDKGYRYYVDTLMPMKRLTSEEVERIRAFYRQRYREMETIIQQTARVLSESTDYISVVLGPGLSQTGLRFVQMVPLGTDKAVILTATETGFVGHLTVNLPPMSPEERERVIGVINEGLQGQRLEDLGRGLIRRLYRELSAFRSVVEELLGSLQSSLEGAEEGERVYTGGTTNILNQPEFRDVEKVKMVLGVLEQTRLVHELLGPPRSSEITITIGKEIQIKEMQDCSVVTASYRVAGQPIGRIGVLGPKRMRYARAVAVVEQVARALSEALGPG